MVTLAVGGDNRIEIHVLCSSQSIPKRLPRGQDFATLGRVMQVPALITHDAS